VKELSSGAEAYEQEASRDESTLGFLQSTDVASVHIVTNIIIIRRQKVFLFLRSSKVEADSLG